MESHIGSGPVSGTMRHVRSARYLRVGTDSLALLARDSGAELGHPLLDRGVWDAVSRAAPRGGYLGRADAMDAIFGDLLPAELLARGDKAGFDELFFGRHSAAFVSAWDGVDTALVDAGALREHWRGGTPRAQSFTLLQAAWLASDDRVEQSLAGGIEGVPAPRPAQSQHRQ